MIKSNPTPTFPEHKPMNKGLYWTTFVIRFLFGLLILLHLTAGQISSRSNSEIFLEKSVVQGASGGGSIKNMKSRRYYTTYITTNKDNYTFYYIGIDDLNPGDTILIERNFLNKPIYFSKDTWDFKYVMNLYRFYYVLFALTIFSFLLKGVKKSSKIFLYILSISDSIAFLTFFFA